MMITLVSYFDSDKSNFCKFSPVAGAKINSNPKNVYSLLIFCFLYETTINKRQIIISPKRHLYAIIHPLNFER